MSVLVREAHLGDLASICHLLMLLFAQEADFSPNQERQLRGTRQILNNPDAGRFLVLEDSGRIIGSVSLLFQISTALGGKVATLDDMIIAPERRGQGFGQQLLASAIERARELGCLRITVLTDIDNVPAQSLYKKLGFTPSAMMPLRLML